MAKRKKSRGVGSAVGSPVSSGRSHTSINIDAAENGYIVNASGSEGDGEGSYWSKRYIAKDRPEALRISNTCLTGGGGRTKGGKKKVGGKKKISLKRG